jgi:hypothetical protein
MSEAIDMSASRAIAAIAAKRFAHVEAEGGKRAEILFESTVTH